MPTPPLPDVPCVRFRLIYNVGGPAEAGSRAYLSYSGSAPSPANCVTLATDIASAWNTSIAPLVNSEQYLQEVDVIDIASISGASGQWTGSYEGTNAGTALPENCAVNVEFNIARRYRGGKPRMFFPPPPAADLGDRSHWSGAFVTAFNTATTNFFNAIEALSIGSMGTLQHVNLSYFHGHNTSTPPWRGPGYKYPPLYRPTALHDVIEGYATKSVVGSQRRRRTATTP